MNRRSFLNITRPSPIPEIQSLGISSGLEKKTTALDHRATAHLLRRAAFGVAPDLMTAYLGKTASTVAEEIVEEAVALPLPEPPPWVNDVQPGRDASQAARQEYQRRNRDHLREWSGDFFSRMATFGLREKMTLFWHDHFVTAVQNYKHAPYAYQYLTTLRTYALGNFKDFVYAIGIDPAMLYYLNGRQNRKGEANENYARELLELFTMGIEDSNGNANYTQKEIEEVARALTGWIVDRSSNSSVFVPSRHDLGTKSFFGQTGNFRYDDVVNVLFEERAPQIAEYIAAKIYREFVYTEPDASIVTNLAQVFLDNDFEIAPVVSALLSSEHFFDQQAMGAQIKSPVALLVGLLIELNVKAPDELYMIMGRFTEYVEQAVFSPPNVAGWPGHHAWLHTTTYVTRLNVADELIRLLSRTDFAVSWTALAKKLHDSQAHLAPFALPLALAEHLISISAEYLDLLVPEDDFAGDLENNPLPNEVLSWPQYQRDLAKLFLGSTPWYEWDINNATAEKTISNFVSTLRLLPEYQLT